MGNPRENSFPRTTELMEGIDYLIRQAVKMRKPIVINVSFGNNYGSHRGDSLLENYIDTVAAMGRTVIVTGTGNNGSQPWHAGGILQQGKTEEIQLAVGAFEPTLNVQLWKDYSDIVRIRLRAPSGAEYTLPDKFGTNVETLDQTQIAFYNSAPSPFQRLQEYYFEFFPIADLSLIHI